MTMALKRKRSVDTLTSPASTSSFLSRASHSPTPQRNAPVNGDMDFAFTFNNPSLFWPTSTQNRGRAENASGRTRKRFRDGRPDERAIHENTLQKLFSAQRSHPDASPIASQPLSAPTPAASKPQKSTLHSFWSISQPQPVQLPPVTMDIDMDTPQPEQQKCEDCERPLQADDSDIMMDVDGDGTDAFACRTCGKKVCGVCAVHGDEWTCLSCAFNR